MAVDPSSINLNLDRDGALDDFAKDTLSTRYMIPSERSPQEAYARASAAFADDEAHAQRLYDYVSKGWFMFATPLLSNGGAARGLPISCFLTTIEDDLQAIFDHYAEVGWLSAKGGGVGSYYGHLRSLDEPTAKGSKSSGIAPVWAVDDRLILQVSQGVTRRGSHAIYLDIHHPEVREFITCRKTGGGDVNRKALNLHNALCITDEFMLAVRDDRPFDLRDPHSGRITETVKARDLWQLALETRMQTGEPYFFFSDTANRGLPPSQRAKGLRIHHSNLCVSPFTEVLTEDGYRPIAGLWDQLTKVWNGLEWAEVSVRKTGEMQELVRVWFEDGGYLDCTPTHKFYDVNDVEIPAACLKDGTELARVYHPTIRRRRLPAEQEPSYHEAYIAGWTTFAGYEDQHRLATFVHDGVPAAIKKRLAKGSVDMHHEDDAGTTVRFEPKNIVSGMVPLGWQNDNRKAWLAGALDAFGSWIDLDGERYLSMACDNADMVKFMRLMALELGYNPRVRYGEELNAFMLNGVDVSGLILERHLLGSTQDDTGADSCARLSLTAWRAPPVVASVQPLPFKMDTYCFTEYRRHRGVFNGILTGQCTEIMLATGRDDDNRKRTAVCCLSSVNADTFDEWCTDVQFIEDMFRMLDNCLTDFIENAPPAFKDAVYSALMERSVGLGLMGFHSFLQRHNVAFESDEARRINMMLFRHMRAYADKASLVLGAERGEAPDMAGTGERFAHKMANAPNASSSIIAGVSPSTELNPANAYLHKTLGGSFTVKNRYLVALLDRLGQNTPEVWKSIYAHEGSVQQLDCLNDHEKAVFKTGGEVGQRWVIQHAIDRGGSIDQGQSLNLRYPSLDPNAAEEEHAALAAQISQDHYFAWAGGLKSLYYLRSTTPKRAENVNTTVERAVVKEQPFSLGDLSALTATGLPVVEDEECFACQG